MNLFPVDSVAATGRRALVFWSWAALWLLTLVGAYLAPEMSGHFRGAPIELRRFMQVYTAVMAAAQVACLAPLATALIFDARARPAGVLFALAAAALIALALLPLGLGAGPFAADSATVRALRVLVFAPSLLRSAGALSLWQIVAGPRERAVGSALFVFDLAASAWCWWSTPYAVVARVHALETSWLLVVWLAVAARLLWRLRRR